MEKVSILGKTLQGDFTNPDWAAKYEETMEQIGKEYRRAERAERGSEGLRIQCNAVIAAFDTLFGPGSAQKVLGKETNLLICLDAFAELAQVYAEQIAPVIEEKARRLKLIANANRE